MFDIDTIIKKYVGEDGSIPADAVAKLSQAVSSSVGREFVAKDRYNEKLEEIDTLKTEKQTAEDNATTAGKWKDKYTALKGEFDNYKAEQTGKEAKAAKERAARAFFEGKGITGKSLDIAMRGSGAEINALELDGDKIKDTAALDALVKDTYSGLVSTTTVRGAQTANPPANNGGAKTKAEIMSIKNTAERQRAIAQNLPLFTATTNE